MSGLVRRIVISATATGLLLQPHGHQQHHKPLHIDFTSKKLAEHAEEKQPHRHDVQQLEVHGLIGFINIANLSYLIAITRREEVASIAGKPVYLVADVALLPLTTQWEANEAIKNALATTNTDSDGSDSDLSDNEDGGTARDASVELGSTPSDEPHSSLERSEDDTRVAEDVARGRVSFGKFATQWFSKNSWSPAKPAKRSLESQDSKTTPVIDTNNDVHAGTSSTDDPASTTTFDPQPIIQEQRAVGTATLGLLHRILRTTKLIFTSGSYFFSYDVDLTRRFEKQGKIGQTLNLKDLDSLYFWNKNLGTKLLESSFSSFLTPVLQGFVGQRAFTLSRSKSDSANNVEVKQVSENVADLTELTPTNNDEQMFLLTLISRRSTKRSGLRYLRRGIDDEGNCANFVETEQVISTADWNPATKTRAFVQVRGSIPLYFSQSPYSFKPAVAFQNSKQQNQTAYKKHFASLQQAYGAIQIALMVDRHGNEKPIGEAYESMYNQTKEQGLMNNVSFHWFDFHAECRGMKFENVSRLVDTVTPFLNNSSETIMLNNTVISRQQGVIRTNCMDCLDRTNVAQSALAQQMLQNVLAEEGFTINFVTDTSTNWFNTLWADNGDAVSRLYAGTAALKGDFTRTRKRNWRGAIYDFSLTLTRYYGNMVNDYFSQTVIDLLLGNVSWRVFEDFESSMMSADPGISVSSARESSIETCSKVVISDPDKEDLLHAWTMMVPAVENTLRTLPLEEAVILLSDAAIYCCRMDWTTEKVARVERIDLRNVRRVKVGTYVVSTFTERQMDEDVNQGLVIYYVPSRGDMVRVNTRSLSNYHEVADEDRHPHNVDGGTGVLSWLTSSNKRHYDEERVMALKVVIRDNELLGATGDDEHGHLTTKPKTGWSRDIAFNVADEIRRAITGSTELGEQRGKDIVVEGDIIGAEEARKRTGYLEQAGQQLKKMVWA